MAIIVNGKEVIPSIKIKLWHYITPTEIRNILQEKTDKQIKEQKK